MNEKEFLNFIIDRNYAEIQMVLQNGFDVNKVLNNEVTAIECASYSDDIKMIEILWNAGAKPTTEYVEEIIKEFEKGKTYLDFEKETENIEEYPNLTENFSVTKLAFLEGSIVKDEEENQHTIFLPISKFVLDNEIVETSIRLDFITLEKNLEAYIGKSLTFPINPVEGYIDGSVYIRHTHIPVDVTEIKIINIQENKLTAEITMSFDFEFEKIGFKNENIIKKVELEIYE